MKNYEGELKVGMHVLYNGEVKRWVNPKTGKVNEVMRQGEYIISRITSDFIYVKSNRKNAATEHQLFKHEIVRDIKELEFKDITCTMGLICMNLNRPRYILADDNFKKLLASAKKYNKG